MGDYNFDTYFSTEVDELLDPVHFDWIHIKLADIALYGVTGVEIYWNGFDSEKLEVCSVLKIRAPTIPALDIRIDLQIC